MTGVNLIVFTVSNRSTGKVYVGSTRNPLLLQWEKIVEAAESGLDYPLYQEIRAQGADSFQLEEWDYADDRAELQKLEREALETFGAESLRGYKTAIAPREAPVKKPRPRATVRRSKPTAEPTSAATEPVEQKESGPVTHVNGAGESVVRFDGKRTSVKDAIAGIGNRVPEYTVIDPLSRSRGEGASKVMERIASRSEKNANGATAAEEDAPAATPPKTCSSPGSDQVLAEALATLQQLRSSTDTPTDPEASSSAANGPQEEIVTETVDDAHAQQLREAISRQRQHCSERCQQQTKRFNLQQVERIEALELLAQQKMARLGSAA
ncbi:GIY-YIG nuclease family protein [Aestuariirhabdus sp. LZHN29]|uniref:GIY-YIG nuclease family protein n=1 Tax=Aestuariirhabdus sp. LZHN29 TaxID=3417462 RepID=UPI003CF55F29